jgi:hypothetical protein
MNKKEVQALFRSIEAGELPNDVDVDVVHKGRTPLMHALICGRAGIASQLINKGAQVNAIESEGARWPYDVRSNHWQVIEMLIGATREKTRAHVATNARVYSAQVLALFGG